MHRKSFAFWCYSFLLIVASLESHGNSTSDDIIQYESYLTFMKNQDIETKWPYKWRENITEDNNKDEYKFSVNSMLKEIYDSDDLVKTYEFFALRNYEEDNRMIINTNSTHAEDENCSISHEFQNFNEDNNNIYTTYALNKLAYALNNTYALNNYIQLCFSYPLDKHLVEKKCEYNDLQIQKTKNLNQMFQFIIYHDSCKNESMENTHLQLNEIDLVNNTFFTNLYQCQNNALQKANYCLDNVCRNKYDIKIYKEKPLFPIHITVGIIISTPFLLATFVIYSILPELQNMHGYTLRAHVSSLFVTYVILAVYHRTTVTQLGYTICLILALFLTFFFSASFFWLNVICFDIWWTFRKQIYSSQGNIKQQERKKFMYALYGWGCAFVLIIIYVMIDYILPMPENFIRPEFCICTFWFSEKIAKTYYFYIPMSITIVCNICLFISTALMIARHKKDTAQHLRHSTNKRQDNKQWFKMYLKLFVLMGINWIMEMVIVHLWLIDESSLIKRILNYICYITDMINALQGVIIFIIFVCKKKIKLLLMKRLGCQNHKLCKNPTNNDCHSISHTTASISMQSINSVQELFCEQFAQ